MKNRFEVSYMTTLPLIGNAPSLSIIGTDIQQYIVEFHEFTDNSLTLISTGICKTNETILANAKQWYTEWNVIVKDENNKVVFSDGLCLANEVVFIKIDAWALGDTIAWIPYVEKFRRKHNCKVICSTFHNDILIKAYPNIMFSKPNTIIENVYAQYYIGASNDGNMCYSPIRVNDNPLQKVATSILGLEFKEIRPDLRSQYTHISRRIEGDYVCISEYGSDIKKHWRALNGWQMVVDGLNTMGYKVVVISKEPSQLNGVIHMTGNLPLKDRMIDLMYAKFFIGVSSGLSWLSWSMGVHTIMISDVTPNWHEFQSGITRLNANVLESVNYNADNETEPEKVLKLIEELRV